MPLFTTKQLFTNTESYAATEPTPSTIVGPSTPIGYERQKKVSINPVFQWDSQFGVFRRGPHKYTNKEVANNVRKLRKEREVLRDRVKVLMDEVDRCNNEVKIADIKRKRAEKKTEIKSWKRKYFLRSRNKKNMFYK
jgi:hypothetical protein